MSYPKELRYTKEHEWIRENGDSAMIGITDYAQNSLGDIVFVELPKTGAALERGKRMGTVESVKAVSEIYAPVSGTVAEVDSELNSAPEKINSEPHGAWLAKNKVKDSGELSGLLSAEDYEKFVAEEAGH